MRDLILGVVAQVADDIHADPLVELLLEFVGQRQILDDERIERETKVDENRRHLFAECSRQFYQVRGHVEEWDLAAREGVRHATKDRIAQMIVEVRYHVHVARTAHLLVKEEGIGDVIRVDAESAQSDHAEVLVADRDWILCAPLLVGLQTRRKEVDVGLERRLKCLVPVSQIREDGQCPCF